MMPKKNKIILALGLILALSLFLRIWKLSSLPQGVDWDEASYGYNAYSILKTGRDEWGKFLPLTFRAFGDSKQPLLVYLNIPFIALFGLNMFSVRIVSALAGTVSVALIFLIGRKLFRNDMAALIAAFLATLSPYGIFYSRIGTEISLWSSVILGAVYWEILYIEKKRMGYWILALSLILLSFFCYNPARVLAPALVVFFSAGNLAFLKTSRKGLIPATAVLLLLLLVLFFQSRQSWNSRMQYVGIFGQGKSVALEIAEYREDDKNSFISKALHNKATFLTLRLYRNYFSHFSTGFLGYSSEPKVVQVAFHSPLYIAQIPFYYLGLFLVFSTLLKKKKDPEWRAFLVLLLWILAAPLPSSITEGDINKRYMGTFGTWELLSAYGLWSLFAWAWKSGKKGVFTVLITCLFGLLYLSEAAGFLNTYFVQIPAKFGSIYFERQKEMGLAAARMYNREDRIVVSNSITGEPHIFPLFFMQFPPGQFRATKQWTESDTGWVHVSAFGKTTYIDTPNLAAMKLQGKTGFIVAGKDLYANSNMVFLKKHHINVPGYRKEEWNPDKIYTFEINND